ncbi:putative glycoside hydrolase [Paenibacillus flagellatus]|uniref:GTP-binding protein n=1 Tax=Paenibacillus flagellatus TaxID=2211139 RepID=A0A2V5JWF1_9BACL|nr:putative glycoside hydrolase [Paenibacillus flagellatus]PYI51099.1 GTP-binding protein [Paenibacillus flagellatus]
MNAVVKLILCACLLLAAGCQSARHGQPDPSPTPDTPQTAQSADIKPSTGDKTQPSKEAPASPANPTPPNETRVDHAAPSPDTEPSRQPRPKAKGIYVSGWAAGTSKMNELIRLVEQTELNAMVIDVKNDSGQLTYDSHLPQADEFGTDAKHMIPDIRSLLSRLKEKRIYTIARIVVFKDPYMAGKRQDWAMHAKTGQVWTDKRGVSWVNPYNTKVWRYTLDIAKEAADLGFDEIQFDYVRFPDNGQKVDREVAFQNPNGWTKATAIRSFLKQAKSELGPKGVYVSADVFGMTTTVPHDMGIGQKWEELAPEIDVISPMIYPSHYGNGALGIKNPDLQPYVIVQKAVSDALKRNEALTLANVKPAAIRPWLQDFTATWVKPHKTYGNADVRAQIQAAKELGVDEYLLWNAGCTYTFR